MFGFCIVVLVAEMRFSCSYRFQSVHYFLNRFWIIWYELNFPYYPLWSFLCNNQLIYFYLLLYFLILIWYEFNVSFHVFWSSFTIINFYKFIYSFSCFFDFYNLVYLFFYCFSLCWKYYCKVYFFIFFAFHSTCSGCFHLFLFFSYFLMWPITLFPLFKYIGYLIWGKLELFKICIQIVCLMIYIIWISSVFFFILLLLSSSYFGSLFICSTGWTFLLWSCQFYRYVSLNRNDLVVVTIRKDLSMKDSLFGVSYILWDYPVCYFCELFPFNGSSVCLFLLFLIHFLPTLYLLIGAVLSNKFVSFELFTS